MQDEHLIHSLMSIASWPHVPPYLADLDGLEVVQTYCILSLPLPISFTFL